MKMFGFLLSAINLILEAAWKFHQKQNQRIKGVHKYEITT
ncbi:hypothetical protein C7437_10113 [Psychrobacillus insolitus]|uniref:Uncharacterized protein n=1 Tax=Psychrobacillus insolitus TaxID=1461 RepID=A0A2W7N4P3_9BACI|nr:hypothetical protein C7437_10113 [Psychrobacillus insolitus]